MNSPPIPFTIDLAAHPDVIPFLDGATNTISYIVHDPASPGCAVIDPVMDFDYAAGRISFENADAMIARIQQQGWSLEWLIETHPHADHLSSAPYIQQRLGGRRAIGENIKLVQATVADLFNDGAEFHRDGSQFDRLFKDGDGYSIGTMPAHAMDTPGHTPACMTHVIGDAAFVGDALLMPDGGSARTDFPGGDAETLYHSIRRLLSLPSQVRIFVCHDYGASGRAIRWETSVAEERAHNIHARDGIGEAEFVTTRRALDARLTPLKLMLPALQVNIRGGRLPPPDGAGRTFLKVPVNAV